MLMPRMIATVTRQPVQRLFSSMSQNAPSRLANAALAVTAGTASVASMKYAQHKMQQVVDSYDAAKASPLSTEQRSEKATLGVVSAATSLVAFRHATIFAGQSMFPMASVAARYAMASCVWGAVGWYGAVTAVGIGLDYLAKHPESLEVSREAEAAWRDTFSDM